MKTIKKTRKRKLVNNDADEDDGDFENDAMTFASRSEVGTQGPSGVNILTAPCSSGACFFQYLLLFIRFHIQYSRTSFKN